MTVTGAGSTVLYQTPNGAKSAAQIQTELKAANWDGKGDPVAVYNQTAAAGKPSTTTTQTVAPTAAGPTQLSINPNDLAAIQNAFGASSGFSIKQLEEQKREFDLQQAAAKDQMERIGIPQLEIQKRLADAQVAFQNSQMEIARQNELLQEAGVTGTYNGQPTEAARQFNQSQALQYLTQASQFAASDPFQLSDFMRGAAATNPQLPQFLQNLQNNVTGGAAGNVGPQATPATTLPMLSNAMQAGSLSYANQPANVQANYAQTYGPNAQAAWENDYLQSPTGPLHGLYSASQTINPQTDSALNAIGGIYNKGASQLGAGALESLTPEELQTFQQGITRLYGSQAAPAFLQQYQATRPAQTAARSAFF